MRNLSQKKLMITNRLEYLPAGVAIVSGQHQEIWPRGGPLRLIVQHINIIRLTSGLQSIATVGNTDEIFYGIIHLQNNGSTLIFELPSIIRLTSDLQSIVTIRNILWNYTSVKMALKDNTSLIHYLGFFPLKLKHVVSALFYIFLYPLIVILLVWLFASRQHIPCPLLLFNTISSTQSLYISKSRRPWFFQLGLTK